MIKYEPLNAFLARRHESEIPMRFEEIEGLIGAPLPRSAFKHRAWWSNNPSNSVITRAWLDAGFKTERVDMASRRLVFRRARLPQSTPPVGPGGVLAALRQALGGTAKGSDLTTPTGEDWKADRT